LISGRGFLTKSILSTDFTNKFATFPHTDFTYTDFIDFRRTSTLSTTIRFKIQNKIKFGGISRLIFRFYRLCQFGMWKLKFFTETNFTNQRSPLVSKSSREPRRLSTEIRNLVVELVYLVVLVVLWDFVAFGR
jgi:hypothetical protein